MKSDLIDIEVEILVQTEKDVRIHDGKTAVWLPLSQIEIERTGANNIATVTMPEGLALEKGLI